MNNIDLINKLYKPYKITKKGKVSIIETTEGKYVIKEKNKNIKELFEYLKSRNFYNFPKLVDYSRSNIDIYEYKEDYDYPSKQKINDLIDVVSKLHNNTSYNKEVTEDKFKEIYDNIKSNLDYNEFMYNNFVNDIEKERFLSPSHYLFIRNSSKIFNEIKFAKEKLNNWYDKVKEKKEYRVSIVHNNLRLNHYIKEDDTLISWDKSSVDTPILDIYNLYKNESNNIDLEEAINKYIKDNNLSEEERELLFILLCIPKEINLSNNEYDNVVKIEEMIEYTKGVEKLIRPYYIKDEIKE